MADRRSDDTPLAPRRSLGGPSPQEDATSERRRPLTERMSAVLGSAKGAGSAPVTSAAPGSRATGSSGGSRAAAQTNRPATRKARLRLLHLDPWSVMKTAFLLSIALGIVTVVSVGVVWSVLDAAGVWDSINSTVGDVIGGQTASTFDVQNYVGTSRVMGFTMIIAVVDVVLLTAIATLGAFLYNLAATLLGGIEVTLAEDAR